MGIDGIKGSQYYLENRQFFISKPDLLCNVPGDIALIRRENV